MLVIGIMLLVIIVTIYTWPKSNLWYLTLRDNNEPYDVDFLYELIEESNEQVEFTEISDFYEKSLSKEDSNANILKITYALDFDSTEVHELLNYVDRGNKAFFIVKDPPKLLLASLYYDSLRLAELYKVRNLPYSWEWEGDREEYDSLKAAQQAIYGDLDQIFSTRTYTTIDTIPTSIGETSTDLHYLVGNNTAYNFEYRHFYFSDSLNFERESLGKLNKFENFFRVKHGKGEIYFHTTPLAFTNYHLYREETLEYAKAFAQYFNNGNVHIDKFRHYYRREYDSEFRSGRSPHLPSSPLAFILSISALKWTWYLSLAGLFVFVVFRSKRNQRIIPVISPIKNNSLEFSKTVGRLFYKEKNHKRMAQEVCQYFFNFLRKRYHINTKNFDELSKQRFLRLFPHESRRINIIAHLSVKSHKKGTEITQKELEDLYEATRYFILKSK
jgi:hypothetical protein